MQGGAERTTPLSRAQEGTLPARRTGSSATGGITHSQYDNVAAQVSRDWGPGGRTPAGPLAKLAGGQSASSLGPADAVDGGTRAPPGGRQAAPKSSSLIPAPVAGWNSAAYSSPHSSFEPSVLPLLESSRQKATRFRGCSRPGSVDAHASAQQKKPGARHVDEAQGRRKARRRHGMGTENKSSCADWDVGQASCWVLEAKPHSATWSAAPPARRGDACGALAGLCSSTPACSRHEGRTVGGFRGQKHMSRCVFTYQPCPRTAAAVRH